MMMMMMMMMMIRGHVKERKNQDTIHPQTMTGIEEDRHPEGDAGTVHLIKNHHGTTRIATWIRPQDEEEERDMIPIIPNRHLVKTAHAHVTNKIPKEEERSKDTIPTMMTYNPNNQPPPPPSLIPTNHEPKCYPGMQQDCKTPLNSAWPNPNSKKRNTNSYPKRPETTRATKQSTVTNTEGGWIWSMPTKNSKTQNERASF
mmetsp:Transcript_3043/g.4576  ORF Transcript_3043/g.4576 Transcript_3043/m.4576 type:complete len:201 (-) Transcript_3043:556-1158(-)